MLCPSFLFFMKKSARIFVLLLPSLLFLSNCNQSKIEQEESGEFFIQGSDTELSLVRSLVKEFLLVENSDMKFNVNGGGSNDGIERLIQGKIDVANASRLMTDDEYTRANENEVKATQIIIATDALAFITHPKLGVDSLSMEDLKGIYDGRVKNWKEVGGPDLPIKIYSRDHHSGTYSFVKSKFVGDKKLAVHHYVKDQNELIEAVKSDMSGIGYVGVGSLINESGIPKGDVWTLSLYIDGDRAYSPFETNAVKQGDYPITRPLLQYFKHLPKGELRDLIDFELSDAGQAIVQKMGYFPISDIHRQINRENGIY